MKLRFKKVSLGLVPFDSQADESLAKWKVGDLLEVDVKRPRNYGHHKKFFAMLNILYENTDHFENQNEALEYLKIKCGIYKTIKVGDKFYPITGSINFASMDQDKFNAFYDKAIDAAIAILPIERDDLFERIAKF